MILLEVSEDKSCETLPKNTKYFDTFFNYVCFSTDKADLIQKLIKFSVDNEMLLILDSLSSAKVVPKNA